MQYLTPAHDICIHGEQVHNFSLSLVTPLRSENNGHFVLRLFRDTERRHLRATLPWPLHHRLPVEGTGLSSVNVSHSAVGCHAAAAAHKPELF